MRSIQNPGRVAGLWYLLLVLLGPVRLIYIAGKLLDLDNPAATVTNIASHQSLFRFGIVTDLACAIILIFLVMAFYRLFQAVDQHLALLVIIFGGIMPALINFVTAASDLGVLLIVRGAPFLSAFNQPQQNALAVLLLKLHNLQITAAETLWGLWLLPLALLVYRSRFLPRFLGVWLALNGLAYLTLSLTGILAPEHYSKLFLYSQPALFAELALMLWLIVKGATPKTPVPPLTTGSTA